MGDFWVLEKITDTRWDIIDGREKGSISPEGVYVADTLKAHTHPFSFPLTDDQGNWRYSYRAHSSWEQNSDTFTTQSTGGTETAPKHIAVPHYIKI